MPAVVEHNTNSTAVLDCQYALGDEPPDRVRLVTVKWYLEGRQVYQWLWGTDRPSAQGLLKGRLNLDHTASPEELMKHRAISIANPTTELGGRYTCTVSTDQGQDSRSKTMIVYGEYWRCKVQAGSKIRAGSAFLRSPNRGCGARGGNDIA